METAPVTRAPAQVERFVKQLYVTSKTVKLYPPTNSIPRDNAAETLTLLRTLLQANADVRVVVSKDGFACGGLPVAPGQDAYAIFAREFYSRNVAEIRFHSGAGVDDILGLLNLLNVTPEDLLAAGGIESRLWDLGVDGITIREVAARIVEVKDEATAEEAGELQPYENWPPSTDEIDELLLAAFNGRPRERSMVVRIIEDPKLVGAYLQGSVERRGSTPAAQWVANRLGALARIVQVELPEDQPALMRSLAEGLLGVDEDLRRETLGERMLSYARHDTALASVIGAIELDELCVALVAGTEESKEAQNGLARALQNLIRLGHHDRDDVIAAASRSMSSAGMAESAIESVLADAAPAKLTVQKPRAMPEESPVTGVLKLVDLAGSTTRMAVDVDGDVAALREEARRGITDGDVLGSLVTIATVERRDDEFANVMSVIEDNARLLIDRQEFGIAAWSVEALAGAADDTERDPAQCSRIRDVIVTLAGRKAVGAITQALRTYPPDSPENAACRALVKALGEQALPSMLEALADEPDMGARKALVDLLAQTASPYIDMLGSYVGDSRWFFVRNVVSILARTHTAETLPYLQRTLRYPDPRVRRETIRAAAGIKDAVSGQMLLTALHDEDAQNVQLAARYLGAMRWSSAVKALQEVALGEGVGNRDTGARSEAIEALGMIGDRAAVPALETLARSRGLLARNRSRELRAAAGAALQAIKSAATRKEG